ncbi:retropepsin-like aspartic protease [Porphyromonas macacae]|uniref:Predicted aspartyl protease n=1 Tax=Porphyromonas macacae TaxID=28115 RepID=A0A379DGC8_9PORP|nr:retropepsin-like aspartic protease [Porphyromonas macacae]SUB77192.1 Predicted aspartyl protease [Porphyromonas macacae]
MKRTVIYGFIIFLLVLFPSKGQTKTTYKDYGDAVNCVDFEAAYGMAKDSTERSLVEAFEALYSGNPQKAEKLLLKNPYGEKYKQLLCEYYDRRGMWEDANRTRSLSFRPTDYYIQLKEKAPRVFTIQKSDTIPIIKLNYAKTPFIEVQINGKKKKMMIDTGCSMSVLSAKTAKECDIEILDKKCLNLVDANEKGRETGIGIVENIKIGELTINKAPIIIQNKIGVSFMGMKVAKMDGIIGWDIISKIRITIDWPDKQVIIEPTKERTALESENLFWIKAPHVLMQTASGEPIRLLLDTGANKTTFSAHAGPKMQQWMKGKGQMISFGIHSINREKIIKLKNVILQHNNQKINLPESSIDGTKNMDGFILLDGLLGNDILSKGKITIDSQAGFFHIAPADHPTE